MLFHIAHTHTAENCSAHKPERLKKFAALVKEAEGNGVHIRGLYVAPWEHTFYGVVEAESVDSLESWVDPILELGTAKITPVTDALTTIERRLGGSQ